MYVICQYQLPNLMLDKFSPYMVLCSVTILIVSINLACKVALIVYIRSYVCVMVCVATPLLMTYWYDNVIYLFPYRERTKDVIANPRELNQAVTFLHENGKDSVYLFNFEC